jgi:hypothetical protein
MMRRSLMLLSFAVAFAGFVGFGSNAQAAEQCAPWLGCSSCKVVLGNSWVRVNGTKELCNDRCGCKLETCSGVQHLRTMFICQTPHTTKG